MATQTVTKPLFGASGHDTKRNVPYFNSIVIDYASQTHTSTDVIEALHVPANTMVLAAGIDVLTLDAGTGQVALGDGTVVYVAAGTLAAAGQEPHSDAVAEMFVSYDAANTLDVTHSVAVMTTAKIRVWAIMLDYTDPVESQRVTIA